MMFDVGMDGYHGVGAVTGPLRISYTVLWNLRVIDI
jgi:hypothetical protein